MVETVAQANAIAAQTLLQIAADSEIDDLLRINLQSNAIKLAGSHTDDLPESVMPDFVVESDLGAWSYTEAGDARTYTSCAGNDQWRCSISNAQDKSDLELLAEIKVSAIVQFSIAQTRVLSAKFKETQSNTD